MPYVYSTATNATTFHLFEKREPVTDVNQIRHMLPAKIKESVTLAGGTNMFTKAVIETPKGMATYVTPAQMEWLERDPTFKEMVKAGFYKVDTKERSKPLEIDKVVENLEGQDGSAPKTAQDYTTPDKPKLFVEGEKRIIS